MIGCGIPIVVEYKDDCENDDENDDAGGDSSCILEDHFSSWMAWWD